MTESKLTDSVVSGTSRGSERRSRAERKGSPAPATVFKNIATNSSPAKAILPVNHAVETSITSSTVTHTYLGKPQEAQSFSYNSPSPVKSSLKKSKTMTLESKSSS